MHAWMHGGSSAAFSASWGKETAKTADPRYTSLPAFRGRRERSFCQCHNESPGQVEGGGKKGGMCEDTQNLKKKKRVRE